MITLTITRNEIADKIRSVGIEPTEKQIDAVESAIECIAQAWADAALQDATREDVEIWVSEVD